MAGKQFNKSNYPQNTAPSLNEAILQSRDSDGKTMWITAQQIHKMLIGYIIMGTAIPSTTPTTVSGQKLCYFAMQAGTYTRFGNLAIRNGISILAWNGSTWTVWELYNASTSYAQRDTVQQNVGILKAEKIKPTSTDGLTTYVFWDSAQGNEGWFYMFKAPGGAQEYLDLYLPFGTKVFSNGKYYILDLNGEAKEETLNTNQDISIIMNNIGVPVYATRSQTGVPTSPRLNVLAWNPRESLWELKYVFEANGQQKIVELFPGTKIFNILEKKYYILGNNELTEDTGGGTQYAGITRNYSDLQNIKQGDNLYCNFGSATNLDDIYNMLNSKSITYLKCYFQKNALTSIPASISYAMFVGTGEFYKKDNNQYTFYLSGTPDGETTIHGFHEF